MQSSQPNHLTLKTNHLSHTILQPFIEASRWYNNWWWFTFFQEKRSCTSFLFYVHSSLWGCLVAGGGGGILCKIETTRRHFHRQQLDFAEWWEPTVTWADPNNWLAHYPNTILSLCETLRYLGCSNLLFHRGLYCRINLRVLTNLITYMLHCLNTADFVHNPAMSLNVIYFKGGLSFLKLWGSLD